MKNDNTTPTKRRILAAENLESKPSITIGLILTLAVMMSAFSLTSCSDSNANNDNRVVVEVTAAHDQETGEHYFVTDTEQVPSGWVTFRFTNATAFTHFIFLDHLPGDKTIEDVKNEIWPAFQEAMYLIMEDKDPNAAYEKLPEWFADLDFRGGPGFVSGGNTIETTVFLPSGNYVMECYVKSTDGTYHYTDGMAEALVVTEETSEAEEPAGADIQMSLTSQGFGIRGDLTAGEHKVAVSFDEESPGLLGYDVHLARLDEETEAKDVALWMDFSRKLGLVSDHENPAPAEFLGGTHEMPVGNTAYFTVDLEPGRYMWVAEQSADAAMYEEFTIPGN